MSALGDVTVEDLMISVTPCQIGLKFLFGSLVVANTFVFRLVQLVDFNS